MQNQNLNLFKPHNRYPDRVSIAKLNIDNIPVARYLSKNSILYSFNVVKSDINAFV